MVLSIFLLVSKLFSTEKNVNNFYPKTKNSSSVPDLPPLSQQVQANVCIGNDSFDKMLK